MLRLLCCVSLFIIKRDELHRSQFQIINQCNQSYFEASMNKKLWQAIGQQKNVSDHILEGILLNSNSNKSQQGVSSNNNHSDSQKHPIQGNFFDLFDRDISLIRDSKSGFKVQPQRPQELSIQIQSCESQPLDSHYDQILQQKDEVKMNDNPLKTKLKKKVNELHQMVNILAWQLQKMKMGVKLDLDAALSQIISIFQADCKKVKITYQNRIQQLSYCSSCSKKNIQIQRISQQLSQLQQSYLQKENHCLNLTKQLENYKQKGQNPIKSIQVGLLQERGQIIKRLKIQLTELQEQNDQLRIELSSRNYDWEEQQRKYKNSLIQLRFQLDGVHEEFDQKLKRAIDQKQILSQNFCLLKQKYDQLYEQKDKEKFQKAMKKKMLLRRQDNAIQNIFNPDSEPKIQIVQPLKPVQSSTYISKSTYMTPSRQRETKYVDRSMYLKPQYRCYNYIDQQQNITKQHPNFQINSDFDSPLSSLKNTPKGSQKYIRTAKRYNTEDSSFSQAIEKLNQIHNDVKKEIYRTKKSIK